MLLFSTKRAPFTSTHQYDNPKSLCCTRILLIGIVVISVMLQCIWCTVFFRIVFMFGQMKKKISKNSGILNIFYMFVMGGMPDKFSQLLIYISAAMITWISLGCLPYGWWFENRSNDHQRERHLSMIVKFINLKPSITKSRWIIFFNFFHFD